jgi:two-component system, response regulator FlrC
MTHTILIVEDDATLRQAMIDTVELNGYQAISANNGEAALMMLHQYHPDVVVSDMRMDKMDGKQLMAAMQRAHSQIPIIFVTAYATIADAVEVMRQGAVDYLTKPFDPMILIKKIERLIHDVVQINQPIAEDPISKQLLQVARKVAMTNATVLITGESGTGKEVLARFIHDNSERCNFPFIAINCAAIPDNMLEATLFGYEKGAFTGAVKSMPGKFEQAQKGTILLDEITEMDLNLQAKLLRVLQEKEVERIGANKLIPLDVRVLATSNRNLLEAVRSGRFREDLYYRLNVFPMQWQPLRERKKDILPLAHYLISLHHQSSKQMLPQLNDDAESVMMNYDWPGNTREMDNVIQRALILASNGVITPDDLQLTSISQKPQLVRSNQSVKSDEFESIARKLEENSGSRQQVAQDLGISERTLRYKLAKMRDAGFNI